MPVKKIKFPKPLRNKIIVSAEKPEQKTGGGIIIPETAQEQQNKGTIVAVGPGLKGDPMVLKPGMIIRYSEHAGTPEEIDGKEYLIMTDKDVLYFYN